MVDVLPTVDPRTSVLIVSRNEETARGLQRYFESRSLLVAITRHLYTVAGGSDPTALVLFPDEFPEDEAERGMLDLARRYPLATMTVVTANTQRFTELGVNVDDAFVRRLLVLPRPAFSWTIFDHVISSRNVNDKLRDF